MWVHFFYNIQLLMVCVKKTVKCKQKSYKCLNDCHKIDLKNINVVKMRIAQRQTSVLSQNAFQSIEQFDLQSLSLHNKFIDLKFRSVDVCL